MSALYDKESEIYDLLYHDINYEASAREIRKLLKRLSVPENSHIVEAGCGTGRFLNPLSIWHKVEGFDISAGQIEKAKSNYPEINFWTADMSDFELKKPCDAFLCLFSSIGYLVPQSNLEKGIACFARAVKPGGALIIQPWFNPKAYYDGLPGVTTYDSPDIVISRQSISRIEDGNAVLEFHFLVTRKNETVDYFTNRHVLGLYSPELMLKLFDKAGFNMRYTENGPLASRGLYFGKKL